MPAKKTTLTNIAKLSPPRIPNILLRDRLFATLKHLQDYPVIWISASGGSGKTVLAASFLQQTKQNFIWYQIDAGDDDPAAFFDFMQKALQQKMVDKTISLPVFSPEYRKGIDAFARHFSRELFQQLGDGGVLVLDNFQDLPDHSATHQVMKQFLAEIPIGINVIILSRTEPGNDYLRFRANGSIAVVEKDVIALNPEEIEDICKKKFDKLSKKDSRKIAQDLYSQTQGWAAGLVLMLEQTDGVNIPETFGKHENQGLIFDYFAGEIFQRESQQTREFLLKTGLLPFFTIDIAEKLTQNPASIDVLQNLTHRNYFTYRSSSAPDAYEYHPLFRDFLLSRIETYFNAKELREAQIFAGNLLQENGYFTEAAVLYCQAKQWDKMNALVKRQGPVLMQKGRHHLLFNWLQSFPLEYLEKEPWMEYWLGMSLQPVNTRDSRNHFVRVYEKFTQDQDLPGQLSSWSGIIETYIHDQASFTELDYWIPVMEKVLADNNVSVDEEVNARVSIAMFSALMNRQPDNEKMTYWEERVRDVIYNTADNSQRFGLGSQLLLYYTVWTGEMPKATVLLKVLRQAATPDEMDPLSLLLWYSTEATYLWKSGHPVDSIKAVKQGLAVANAFDVHTHDVFLLASGIYSSCALNKFDQAENYLMQMESRLDRSRLVDVVHYHYLASGLSLIRGELAVAHEYAETALDIALKSGSLYTETIARLMLSLILIRQDKLTEVVFHLSRIGHLAEQIKSHSLSYLNRLVASEAAFSCQEMERGVSFLKEAVECEQDIGRVYHGYWWDRSLAENCVRALEQDLEIDFIQRIIRSHELIPAKAPLHLDNWIWPIRIYTLGRFSVTHDGNSMPVTAKSSKKPLELLKALIAHGGRQVSQDALTEILWPDAEGDAASQSLYTTTHRLRKMLSESVLIMEDGRLSLDARYIWVDNLAFLRTAGALQDLLMKADIKHQNEVERLSKQFYKLYQGSFLGEGDRHSSYVAMQEKCHLRFIKLTESLGHFWQQQGQLEKSIACFERALEVDPVAEDCYQSLMTTYQQCGRNSDAVLVFQRCRKNLANILGISPSKITVDIYNAIQK
ncbi:MAG: hypothetical protein GXP13_04900 [Gammaproteobacteria bacterium]|nr:hypothetical protein [Gammaproteobacteria bacterium]